MRIFPASVEVVNLIGTYMCALLGIYTEHFNYTAKLNITCGQVTRPQKHKGMHWNWLIKRTYVWCATWFLGCSMKDCDCYSYGYHWCKIALFTLTPMVVNCVLHLSLIYTVCFTEIWHPSLLFCYSFLVLLIRMYEHTVRAVYAYQVSDFCIT